MEKISCTEKLSKKLSVLDFVMWIKTAISQIKDSYVSKCFHKAGFPVPETITEGENDRNVILSDEEVTQQLPPHLQTSDIKESKTVYSLTSCCKLTFRLKTIPSI